MVAAGDWPDAGTMIPELLSAEPRARKVLDRYGLQGCGGRLGPVESLGFFARAHDVPVDRLLDELKVELGVLPSRGAHARAASASAAMASEAYAPQRADTIYRPFFKAGIAVVLTLGAAWGAWLLLQIAMAGRFSVAGLHAVNAHGHAQIFGWVGLFVMGFAYQAFPRFKHTSLVWPCLAFATLWMMLAGLVVRSLAQPVATGSAVAEWIAIGASVLEVAAIVLFAAIILRTWRKSGRPLMFYDGYILSALFWFVVQAIYESIYLSATLAAEGERLVSLVATWQPALRDVQIHGFALLMILGVSQRIFHHFYGLREPNEKLSRRLLVVLNVAVVGEALGLILMPMAGRAWAGLWYASSVVLAGAVVLLVADWRIFFKPDDHDRSLKFLRAAYVWLFISLAMLVALPLYQFVALPWLAASSAAAEMGFSHAYYGAVRHAITVGFVSLMIVGVAAKVVPTLGGVSAEHLSSLWGPFVLINLGCALRVTGQTATDFTTFAFPIAGVSGILEVTGLGWWGVHLWRVMAGRGVVRGESQTVELSLPVNDHSPLQPQHTVAAVLDRYPELLDVFLDHGFTTLAQPHFRQTIARVVTIEKACRRTGVDLTEFLTALNVRRTPIEGHDVHPSAADAMPPQGKATQST